MDDMKTYCQNTNIDKNNILKWSASDNENNSDRDFSITKYEKYYIICLNFLSSWHYKTRSALISTEVAKIGSSKV